MTPSCASPRAARSPAPPRARAVRPRRRAPGPAPAPRRARSAAPRVAPPATSIPCRASARDTARTRMTCAAQRRELLLERERPRRACVAGRRSSSSAPHARRVPRRAACAARPFGVERMREPHGAAMLLLDATKASRRSARLLEHVGELALERAPHAALCCAPPRGGGRPRCCWPSWERADSSSPASECAQAATFRCSSSSAR